MAACAAALALTNVWPTVADETAGTEQTAPTEQVTFVPSDAEATVPARFQLQPHQFSSQRHPLPDSQFSWGPHFAVTFPSPVSTDYECNNTVHCEYFRPQGAGTHAGVIVLHILGGDFELSRVCCRGLAMQGVGALFVKMPYYGPRRPVGQAIRMISDDLDQTVDGMTQAVLDIRRATAWLASREEIDADRLGITGISLGGIVSALAASAEPRLQRACLVLAGGNLEKIIRESDETEKIRAVWAARQFDLQLVQGKLNLVDPLTYADQLRQRKVLMFNARHDTTVPPDCTKQLWEAIGRPEIHWWNANHYSAIWFLPAGVIQMAQFFTADGT